MIPLELVAVRVRRDTWIPLELVAVRVRRDTWITFARAALLFAAVGILFGGGVLVGWGCQ